MCWVNWEKKNTFQLVVHYVVLKAIFFSVFVFQDFAGTAQRTTSHNGVLRLLCSAVVHHKAPSDLRKRWGGLNCALLQQGWLHPVQMVMCKRPPARPWATGRELWTVRGRKVASSDPHTAAPEWRRSSIIRRSWGSGGRRTARGSMTSIQTLRSGLRSCHRIQRLALTIPSSRGRKRLPKKWPAWSLWLVSKG